MDETILMQRDTNGLQSIESKDMKRSTPRVRRSKVKEAEV